MHVRAEIHYPEASPQQTFRLAVDEKFRRAVCEATHSLRYDVSIVEADGGATVVVERTIPADVPDVAKRFVGDTVTVRQTEKWAPAPDATGRRRADLLLEVVGQPARMTGSVVIDPDDSGSRQLVEGDLRVSIPFLGKRLEPEITKVVLAAVRAEQRTGEAWLADQSPTG
ncbi:MAG: DUF2505 domain-containing protein [Nocardioidaceae bacterium]